MGPRLRLPPFAYALRERFRAGYGAADLRADVLAGLVVGIMALPLAMALAIASGVPPQHGLYTAILAGALCALVGGSRLNITGPTAAFVALLAPMAAQFGLGGLLCATVLAGLILSLMGLARMGRLIQFIPYPVTTGFTAGIAVVIAMLQLKDFLGLAPAEAGAHFHDRALALVRALPTLRWQEAAVGGFTLGWLVVWPRFVRRVPAALVAVPLAAGIAFLLAKAGYACDTIGTRFHYVDAAGAPRAGIPTTLPAFAWPWDRPGADGRPLGLDWDLLRALVGPAFAIAMLGAIESLLCAVVADGMAGTRHDPDAELLGQGLGNLLAPFFGGIPATGAIARTATNVRAGGRSPLAGVVHALFVLAAMLLLGGLLRYVPMTALAALLLMAAWNMSDVRHVGHILRVAPRSDTAVLVTCFGLTVLFDMVLAVSVGVVLAALLFMRRMAHLATVRLTHYGTTPHAAHLPPGVVLYEIGGPLFFGAAEKAFSALHRIHDDCRTLVLDLHGVPTMDVSGLVALESGLASLRRRGVEVILAGVGRQPRLLLRRAGFHPQKGRLRFARGADEALAVLRRRSAAAAGPV